MDHRLHDILDGKESNHLLPFLWMNEGYHDDLPVLIQHIYDSGARAFCVESRPHEGFLRPYMVGRHGPGTGRGSETRHEGLDSRG